MVLPWLGEVNLSGMNGQYYLILFFLVLTLFLIYRIVHSPVGKTYAAIRGGEVLAESLGINTRANKLVSFTASAFFAGSFCILLSPLHGRIPRSTTGFDLLPHLLVGGGTCPARSSGLHDPDPGDSSPSGIPDYHYGSFHPGVYLLPRVDDSRRLCF
jgi:hypothetical protein